MPAISETVRVKVRFSEVDPIRMVWHGNYIKYLEDATATESATSRSADTATMPRYTTFRCVF